MLPLPKARFFTLSTPGNILDNAEIKFIMELSLKPYLTQNKLYNFSSVFRFIIKSA